MHTHTAGNLEAGLDVERTPAADVAYRRAWLSLLLYPVTLFASLMIGGGLFSLLDDDVGSIPIWTYLVAITPALLVVVIPGILAVMQGRKAIGLGRPEGRVPAAVGVAVGVALVTVDLLLFILG
jgi:hypothetical protein